MDYGHPRQRAGLNGDREREGEKERARYEKFGAVSRERLPGRTNHLEDDRYSRRPMGAPSSASNGFGPGTSLPNDNGRSERAPPYNRFARSGSYRARQHPRDARDRGWERRDRQGDDYERERYNDHSAPGFGSRPMPPGAAKGSQSSPNGWARRSGSTALPTGPASMAGSPPMRDRSLRFGGSVPPSASRGRSYSPPPTMPPLSRSLSSRIDNPPEPHSSHSTPGRGKVDAASFRARIGDAEVPGRPHERRFSSDWTSDGLPYDGPISAPHSQAKMTLPGSPEMAASEPASAPPTGPRNQSNGFIDRESMGPGPSLASRISFDPPPAVTGKRSRDDSSNSSFERRRQDAKWGARLDQSSGAPTPSVNGWPKRERVSSPTGSLSMSIKGKAPAIYSTLSEDRSSSTGGYAEYQAGRARSESDARGSRARTPENASRSTQDLPSTASSARSSQRGRLPSPASAPGPTRRYSEHTLASLNDDHDPESRRMNETSGVTKAQAASHHAPGVYSRSPESTSGNGSGVSDSQARPGGSFSPRRRPPDLPNPPSSPGLTPPPRRQSIAPTSTHRQKANPTPTRTLPNEPGTPPPRSYTPPPRSRSPAIRADSPSPTKQESASKSASITHFDLDAQQQTHLPPLSPSKSTTSGSTASSHGSEAAQSMHITLTKQDGQVPEKATTAESLALSLVGRRQSPDARQPPVAQENDAAFATRLELSDRISPDDGTPSRESSRQKQSRMPSPKLLSELPRSPTPLRQSPAAQSTSLLVSEPQVLQDTQIPSEKEHEKAGIPYLKDVTKQASIDTEFAGQRPSTDDPVMEVDESASRTDRDVPRPSSPLSEAALSQRLANDVDEEAEGPQDGEAGSGDEEDGDDFSKVLNSVIEVDDMREEADQELSNMYADMQAKPPPTLPLQVTRSNIALDELEYSDTEKRNVRLLEPFLLEGMRDRDVRRGEKNYRLREQYKEIDAEWQIHCNRLEKISSRQKRRQQAKTLITPAIDPSSGLPFVAPPVTPSILAPSSRANRRAAASSALGYGDAARSEAEFLEILASLEDADMRDPNMRAARTTAAIPDMVIDLSEIGTLGFEDENGLVIDPFEHYSIDKAPDSWTDEEIQIFCRRYAQWPKQFGKIAAALPDKTVPQCVLFYYRSKKKIDFRALVDKRHRGEKKKKGKKGDKDQAKKGTSLLSDLKRSKADEEEEEEDDDRTESPGGALPGADGTVIPAAGDLLSALNNERHSQVLNRMVLPPELQDAEDTSAASSPAASGRLLASRPKQRAARFLSPPVDNTLTNDMDAPPSDGALAAIEALGALSGRNLGVQPLQQQNYPPMEAEHDASNQMPKAKRRKASISQMPESPFDTSFGNDSLTGPTEGAKPSTSRRKSGTSSYWSVAEKTEFVRLLGVHGKDYGMIANGLESKTAVQCKNFFQNNTKKLGLAEVAATAEEGLPPGANIEDFGDASLAVDNHPEHKAADDGLHMSSNKPPTGYFLPQPNATTGGHHRPPPASSGGMHLRNLLDDAPDAEGGAGMSVDLAAAMDVDARPALGAADDEDSGTEEEVEPARYAAEYPSQLSSTLNGQPHHQKSPKRRTSKNTSFDSSTSGRAIYAHNALDQSRLSHDGYSAYQRSPHQDARHGRTFSDARQAQLPSLSQHLGIDIGQRAQSPVSMTTPSSWLERAPAPSAFSSRYGTIPPRSGWSASASVDRAVAVQQQHSLGHGYQPATLSAHDYYRRSTSGGSARSFDDHGSLPVISDQPISRHYVHPVNGVHEPNGISRYSGNTAGFAGNPDYASKRSLRGVSPTYQTSQIYQTPSRYQHQMYEGYQSPQPTSISSHLPPIRHPPHPHLSPRASDPPSR